MNRLIFTLSLIIGLFANVELNAQGVERNLVIVEDFTGTWCGYCPAAAQGCDDLVHNGHPVGVIAYHSGDDYATVEAGERIGYYAVEGFPTVRINGSEEIVGGASTGTMYSSYLPVVDSIMEVLTPLALEMTNTDFSANSFTAQVDMEAVDAIDSENLFLFAAITESHLPEVWGPLYEVNFVERQMFAGANGTAVDLTSQTTQSIDIEFDLDDSWNPELCEVVVFVQDTATREIYNAAKVSVAELTDYADITISVQDENGNALSNAEVVFGDNEGTTGASGAFVIEDVEPGVYVYTASCDGFLPGSISYKVVQVDNEVVVIQLLEATLVLNEDFDDPVGWEHQGDGAENWMIKESNAAGGIVPELFFSWSPEMVGQADYLSPMIDLSTMDNATLVMKHVVNDYAGDGYFLNIQASTDGDNWDIIWEMNSPENIGPEMLTIVLSNAYVQAGQIQLKFRFDGNSYQINYWAIDDLWIVEDLYENVEKTSLDLVSVYPNPASDFLQIKGVDKSNVKIYNTSGQLVCEKELVSENEMINISDLKAGTYILRAEKDNVFYSTKFGVQ